MNNNDFIIQNSSSYTHEYSNFPNSLIQQHHFKDADDSVASLINEITDLKARGLYDLAAKKITENANILSHYNIDAETINAIEEEIRWGNKEGSMQYPYVSIYPEGIDDRTYFCDIDLKGQPLMDAYHSLIDERRYTDANILLSQQNEVHHYSADLINYLEAKVKNTQEYISNWEKYSPHHLSNAEPNININEFWI